LIILKSSLLKKEDFFIIIIAIKEEINLYNNESDLRKELLNLYKVISRRIAILYQQDKNLKISYCNGYLASDHIINLLQNVNGYLDKDKNAMLDYINTFLALPRKTQRKYQIARRMGFAGDWTMLDKLSMHYQYIIEQYEKNVPDGEQFESLLKQYMDFYI